MKIRTILTQYGTKYKRCSIAIMRHTKNGTVHLEFRTEEECLAIKVNPSGSIRATKKGLK